MHWRLLVLIGTLTITSSVHGENLYDPDVWDTALQETSTEEERRNVMSLMRWNEEVWGNGQYDLIPTLVADTYTRHQGNGTSVVTPAEYLETIKAWRARGVVFVSSAILAHRDKVWTQWSAALDSETGGREIMRALQVYRFEDARLIETWISLTRGQGAWPNDGLSRWGRLDKESSE
jgi:hypothetical protein